ncbi:MAG: type II toxin-antitoxin system VapC family toxin [Deltaproteobacteria bacterium]|nr:type II toxin-antitoxin system VapC family toxin [Deltaproteobacteria bacterium]
MRLYLDTSVLVKLYVHEEGSAFAREAVGRAQLVATSGIAYVEARAAFARRRYEGGIRPSEHRKIVRDLDAEWERYLVVEVTDALIREAAGLAETLRLRAYDAIHLASARAVQVQLAEAVVFASWDTALEKAARREGLAALQR